ncbi:MAG: hypothetical protein ACJ71Z_05605 [Aeromicrobium sp.]
METAGATHADIVTYAIAFAALGVLLLGFGLWGRKRIDSLLVDSHLGKRLDDDEHDYQATMLERGVLGMFVVGGILIATAIALYFFAR